MDDQVPNFDADDRPPISPVMDKELYGVKKG
jgi:hypothetical protein